MQAGPARAGLGAALRLRKVAAPRPQLAARRSVCVRAAAQAEAMDPLERRAGVANVLCGVGAGGCLAAVRAACRLPMQPGAGGPTRRRRRQPYGMCRARGGPQPLRTQRRSPQRPSVGRAALRVRTCSRAYACGPLVVARMHHSRARRSPFPLG